MKVHKVHAVHSWIERFAHGRAFHGTHHLAHMGYLGTILLSEERGFFHTACAAAILVFMVVQFVAGDWA